ncbi:MAG: MFS transporter, partial [Tumebacillaceae bacterium]
MLTFLTTNPRFFRFWIATWCSELGDSLRNFAMMFLVLDMTNNSGVHYSITLFCEYGTILLFGLFIGVIADRWEKKRTVSMAIVSRALVMTIFMLGVYVQSIWLVYLAATLSALGTVFFRASQSAFVMQFVPKEDRAIAASLRQMSLSVLTMIGPMIGTFIYVQAGASLTLLGTVVLFVLAGGLIWSIQIEAPSRDQQHPQQIERTKSSILQELGEGLRYLWNNTYVRPILFAHSMFGLVSGVMNVMDIFVITEYFNLPREAIAIALPWQAAGMFVGSIVVKRFTLPHASLMSFA